MVKQNLIGRAAGAVAHIPVREDEVPCPPVRDLLMEYERVFLPLADTQAALATFMTAAMEDTETVGQWHARCKANYLHAFPGRTDIFAENDHMLRFRFIAGLPSFELRRTVTQQRARTYAQTKIDAEDMYASFQGDLLTQGSAGASGSDGDAGAARIKREIMAVLGGASTPQKKRSWDSRKPRACFKCGQEDHLVRDCWQRKKKNEGSGSGGRGRGHRGRSGRGRRGSFARGGRGGFRARGGSRTGSGINALGEEEERSGDWLEEEQPDSEEPAEN